MIGTLLLSSLLCSPPAGQDNVGQLQVALAKQDLELARKALAGLDKQFLNTRHLLHRAIEANFRSLVPELLQRGADVNARDGEGRTPLHVAVQFAPPTLASLFGKGDVQPDNEPDVIALLVKHKADLEAADDAGRTPLFYAILPAARALMYRNDLKQIEPLPRTSAAFTEGGHLAAPQARLKFLLQQGAKVNVADKKGLTPLHYAALIDDHKAFHQRTVWKAQPESWGYWGGLIVDESIIAYEGSPVVAALLVAGADPRRTTKDGKTALDLCTNPKSRKLLQAAVAQAERGQQPAPPDQAAPLQAAIAKKDLKLAKQCLAEIDKAALDQGRFIHRAIEDNFAELVPLLLERGASVNLKDAEGRTPLHLALQGPAQFNGPVEKHNASFNLGLVKLLLNHKADLEAEDNQGRTPLFYAVPSASRRLTYHSALDLKTAVPKIGITDAPPAEAALAQLICLLKQGAKVNAADKKGLTPLHYAALIDDPANYAKQTSWSAKAMTFGYLVDSWSSQTKVRYDGLEAVKILLVAGADPHRLTNAGKTAFDLSPSPRTREILDLAMSAKK